MLNKIIIVVSILTVLIIAAANSNPKKIKFIKPEKSFIRVMVIDSGIDVNDNYTSNFICKERGLIDLTETTISDEINHGSVVARLLAINASDSPYCIQVVKYYDHLSTVELNNQRYLQAIHLMDILKPDVVNISAGGSNYMSDELKLLKKNKQIKLFVAAGNDNKNLDNKENKFYPASYALPNINVIGALDEFQKKLTSSNYGDIVRFWELGVYAEGSGTSFATPVAAGKYIKEVTSMKVITE